MYVLRTGEPVAEPRALSASACLPYSILLIDPRAQSTINTGCMSIMDDLAIDALRTPNAELRSCVSLEGGNAIFQFYLNVPTSALFCYVKTTKKIVGAGLLNWRRRDLALGRRSLAGRVGTLSGERVQ
jgi:hypothetical protein